MFAVMGDEGSTERAKKTFGEGARVCWAWNEDEVLMEGIELLATVIKSLM